MQPHQTFLNIPRDKQERIRRAALAEFGEKGYTGASINVLVERLGIAKGSIFQYFGDKKGLFLFVFHSSLNRVKDDLRTVREQTAQAPLFDRIEAILGAGQRFLDRHRLIYRLYLKIMYDFGMPFRNELLSYLRQASIDYLRELLHTARQRGELRADLEIDTVCFVLDAVMDRFLQVQTVPHLDGGLGLHRCDGATAADWVIRLRKLLENGIGVPVP